MAHSTNPLTPTYRGMVTTTFDALVLFQACLDGELNHVNRRPHDRERSSLIRSGNIFIYEEHSSGIKRWTDGITWSPSRILSNFLVYRELNQAFPPGEKKRALKKNASTSKRASTGGIVKKEQPSTPRLSISGASSLDDSAGGNSARDPIRDLVGSLTDSYDFKEGGLVKKTISIKLNHISHHLVSYYTVDDALSGSLTTPSSDPRFHAIQIAEELIFSQTFRAAIDEYTTHGYMAVPEYATNGYMAVPQNMVTQHPPFHAFPPTTAVPHGFPAVPNPAYALFEPCAVNMVPPWYTIGDAPGNPDR